MRSPSGVSNWTSPTGGSGWAGGRPSGGAGVGAAVVAPPDSTVTCHSFPCPLPGRDWDHQRRPAGLGFPDTSVTELSRTLRARWGARVRGAARRSSPDDTCPDHPGGNVARMIVEVMLKPEIHDPQGEAIASACRRLGFGQVVGVRQGKRFGGEFDGPGDQDAVTAVTELARDLLSNPVIAEFTRRAC